ncbi:MAG: LPS assembly lipoprotein LptE [Gammaproteobacteria bacterium]
MARFHTQKLLVLSILLLTVSACGFQLRGQVQLADALKLSVIELDDRIAPTSSLVRRLRELLQLYGAELTEQRDQANARIILSNEEVRRRTLATGTDGDAREFTLTYGVTLQVLSNTGTELLPATRLSVSRNLLYRESELLGSLEGEQMAQRELADELANTVVQRLQSIKQP